MLIVRCRRGRFDTVPPEAQGAVFTACKRRVQTRFQAANLVLRNTGEGRLNDGVGAEHVQKTK